MATSSAAIAPDQSRLYVGGSFLNIAGTAQAELVAVDPITGIRQPIVFQQFVGAPLELEVDPSGTRLYAALSGFPGGGNRSVAWNTNTGVRLWRNEAMGDTQAIEYDAGSVYFGFHEGYGGDVNVRMLVADATSGALDPHFRPTINSYFGVWTIDSGTTRSWWVASSPTSTGGRSRPRDVAVAVRERPPPPTVPANLSSPSRTAPRFPLVERRADNPLLTGYGVLRNGHRSAPRPPRRSPTPRSRRRLRTRTRCGPSTPRATARPRRVDPGHHTTPLVPGRCELALPRQRQRPGHGVARRAFNDTTWASGSAQLGYGDGDEATVVASDRTRTCGTARPTSAAGSTSTTRLRCMR